MKTQSPDTHPEMEKVQIGLLRKFSRARRFSITRSLSQTVIELSRRAIRQAHPGASEEEIKLTFVRLHYGPELAERVRLYLSRRGQ